MNWLKFLKLFLRNLIVFTALSTLLLGGFGYLLSGREGFVNLAYWGLILGLLGSVSSGMGMIFSAKYWEAGNYDKNPDWAWFIKKEEDKRDY